MTRNILIHMFYTLIVSIILNVAVFFIGQAFGVSFAADVPGASSIPVSAVVIASAIGAVVGCLGFWILGFIAGDKQRIWFIWLATIIGLISMIGPWNVSGDLPTMGFLGLMHVVSVLVMTWYLGVWVPRYVTPEAAAYSA
ncbi:MAG: DUF6069 family protein [Anaerolineae bacterium]